MQIDYNLPAVDLPEVTNPSALWDKYAEEMGEYKREPEGFAKVVELWDVLQTVATMLANGGGSQSIEAHFSARRMMEKYSVDLAMEAKAFMMWKNSVRDRPGGGTGYYSPEVCQRIIETGGMEWQPVTAKPCECRTCLGGKKDPMTGWPLINTRFIACSICGNKRCPHATDCSLPCTGSNEPGQAGSIYA